MTDLASAIGPGIATAIAADTGTGIPASMVKRPTFRRLCAACGNLAA